MNVNDIYPSMSENLRAEDLNGQEHNLTIAQVTQETLTDDGKEKRMLKLTFHNQEKGLLLNKTNAMTIADALGQDADFWVGKPIILYPTVTDFGGKMVPCIRVRPVLQQAAAAPLGSPPPQDGPPPDSYTNVRG